VAVTVTSALVEPRGDPMLMHKQNRIRVELRYLQEGPERFGEVGIHNAQPAPS
jgi:hypothetical protein